MGTTLTRRRESRVSQEDLCPRNLYSGFFIRVRNICYICRTHFKTKTRLDEHMERFHAKETYTCDHCNLICETWSKFQHHVFILHDDVAFCTYCYKAFGNFSNLDLHWKTHEPFECVECNETFVTLSDLQEHHTALHLNDPSQRRLKSFYVFRSFTRQEEHN